MARLTVRLLGPVQVTLDGQPVTAFETEKSRALLAYLSAEPGRTYRREALAEMFWPGRPEGAARANLRHALAGLRRILGDRAAEPPFLLSDRHTIAFNQLGDSWSDVAVFSALLPSDLTAALPPGPQIAEQLARAVELYRGPFLEDLSLADSAGFEEWRVLRREEYGRLASEALCCLVQHHERRGDYDQALAHAWRRVELEPWEETAQQQVMRLLAITGRRVEAVAQYEAYGSTLARELGIEPSIATTRLYEQIRDGNVQAPPGMLSPLEEPEAALRRPRFLEQDEDVTEPPVFADRDRELAWLETQLDRVVAGHGQVIFVTGGPGQGKTALLDEFSRRAIEAHSDLLAVHGRCSSYSGYGDPYLPFREVMAMLTGDVQAGWQAGAISTKQARRLWNALPVVIQALLEHAPNVTGVLVPAQSLLARAALWRASTEAAPQHAAWLSRLTGRLEAGKYGFQPPQQSNLFQQVTNLLLAIGEAHPLLLILDDLQWADTASIGLLFHLGRRLERARILIAGAYRPVEVALGQREQRHPLEKMLREFRRLHGDVWLDLTDVRAREQRGFVDALLATEPNRLGEDFRRELVKRTEGHPLFTIELLRAMQARGDLIRDQAGLWTEGRVLDWETVPPRVEGVIEERVGRLDPELYEILSVASVEGEDFSVPVVAQVQGVEENALLRRIAQDLAKRHRLVSEQADVQIGVQRIPRYRFGHALVQSYLYQQLDQAERRLLHGQVAAALESCYGERLDEIAVRLAHHYDRAGDDSRALAFFSRAADNASRTYAYEEACAHYTRAIDASSRARAGTSCIARLHIGRGLASGMLGSFEAALADYESALRLACGSRALEAQRVAWRARLELGRLWASRDYSRAHDFFSAALETAHQLDDASALAESLNWMGNWHLNAEDPLAAIAYHQEALETFEGAADRRGVATTLDLLGIASLLGAHVASSVEYYDRAIALFREWDDLPNLASSLTGRGHAGSATFTSLAVAPPAVPSHSQQDFEEALRITRQIGSPAGEAWVLWSLGGLHTVQGRYGQALDANRNSLDIATHIGHREWIVGSRCMLGYLYVELLAPKEARQVLEPALALAEELQSRHWIHNATGTLAAAYYLLDDCPRARTCLEAALSPETPMDTLHKRYCWARRAELALRQDDPMLALEIVERLIESAPGMSPGCVVTVLWKLKGEALAAMGRPEEALLLLRAAIENARATGERFLMWRLHASLGQLDRAANRGSEAEREFSTARELVRELADSVSDRSLKENFLRRASSTLGESWH